jgi:hypothetical protein
MSALFPVEPEPYVGKEPVNHCTLVYCQRMNSGTYFNPLGWFDNPGYQLGEKSKIEQNCPKLLN